MPTITFKHERLKALREGLGYTQEEFGRRLGVSKQTVSLWEAGRITPTLDSLARIASVFSAKIESFFDEHEIGAPRKG